MLTALGVWYSEGIVKEHVLLHEQEVSQSNAEAQVAQAQGPEEQVAQAQGAEGQVTQVQGAGAQCAEAQVAQAEGAACGQRLGPGAEEAQEEVPEDL